MKMLSVVLSAGCLLAGAWLMTGCETHPASAADITVDPPAATVAFGQSVTFVASGWFGYTWSLSHPEWGYLSQHVGDTVVYASTLETNTVTNAVQILHCKGLTRTNVSGTNTNVTETQTSAPSVDVYIKQL
jgi:hypothetical protein